MLKEIKKGIIIGLSFSVTVFGVVYAANKINYTETVNSGDIITKDYFNSIKNILPIDGSKILDGSISSIDITNNTITEDDIIDSFKAKDADRLDGVDSSSFALKTYVDSQISGSSGITDTGHSFTTNGYQKLGNGLILQWGRVKANSTNYPIPFPNNVLNVQVTVDHNADAVSRNVYNVGKTGFSVRYGANSYYYWMAIGY